MSMNARENSARSSLVGSRIGKFDVIAEIGTGGMASVYLARSTAAGGFNRLVAIKVMHPHLSQEDSFVEMFLDEARVAATIQHPNVVSIIDVGIEEGLIFLIMDYVEGDSFSNIEKMAVNLRRRIPLGIILRVVLDALAGLHYAHELTDHAGTPLKIIHRDVSPQNVVVGVDGTARIVDFGIAKAESRITNTQVGLIKGKLNFMAPEQIRGQALDRRVDVFGMGVTLWEAITLRRLFAGDNEFDTARRILAGEYPSLLEYDARLPPVLDEICKRSLHPDPDQRFRSAAEFSEAIERELHSSIAGPREVSGFISGVATQKLERERRAVRESAAITAHASEPDDDDEPAFMSTTVVEAPVTRAPSPIGPVNPVLPSSSAPRDRSGEENATQKASRFRAPTMTMPTRGGGAQAPAARSSARGVVVDDTPEVGGETRSLRIQAPRKITEIPAPAAMQTPVQAPAPAHPEYDDEGATSPFHAMAIVEKARAFKAASIAPIAPITTPAPPPGPDLADHLSDEDDDSAETGSARTLFQPRYVPGDGGSSGEVPRAMPPQQPQQPAMPQAPAADRSYPIDLVPRPSEQVTAPSPPYPPPQPYAPVGQLTPYDPSQQMPVGMPPQRAFQAPPQPEKSGLPAVVYVLLSVVLVGGAAAVLLYVLRLRNG
ncbi:MAG: serine/threonine-protein kinase [Polyangiales bacterium]